jgi:hypothetical protein
MPAYADVLPAAARWDLVNFVASLARTPAWEKGGSFGGTGFAAEQAQRGEYITRREVCGLCHTQIDRTGIYNVDGAFLAGGMRVGDYPHGYSVSRNLTSDPETGLGRWKVAQIIRALRDGQAPDRPSTRLQCFGPSSTADQLEAIWDAVDPQHHCAPASGRRRLNRHGVGARHSQRRQPGR